MKPYAETQERINGPYVATDMSLAECWALDLSGMVDYNLLRDNAQPEDLETLGGWIHANPDEATEDAMIERIWQRVVGRGWYVRDGKITRTEGSQTVDLNIQVLDQSKPRQLFAHFQGQTEPQAAYIALDIRDGQMWADYNHEISNAVPMTVYHGLVLRWYMPPFLAGTANRIMDTIAKDAQRVLDGASAEWDGSNTVGRYTDDARDAIEDIGIEVNTWADDSADDICWSAGPDWYHDDLRSTLTADTTDAEIAAWMDDDNTPLDYPTAVIDRDAIIEYARQLRDELRAEQ